MPEETYQEELLNVLKALQDTQKPDPTINVLEHVRSEIRRVDDNNSWLKIYFDAAAVHVKEVAALRSAYEEKLSTAEQKRGEALREIDSKTIESVSTQINQIADNFRSQLEAANKAFASSIQEIQRTQYLSAGAKVQQVEGRQQNQWAVGAGIGFLGLGIASAGIVIALSNP